MAAQGIGFCYHCEQDTTMMEAVLLALEPAVHELLHWPNVNADGTPVGYKCSGCGYTLKANFNSPDNIQILTMRRNHKDLDETWTEIRTDNVVYTHKNKDLPSMETLRKRKPCKVDLTAWYDVKTVESKGKSRFQDIKGLQIDDFIHEYGDSSRTFAVDEANIAYVEEALNGIV